MERPAAEAMMVREKSMSTVYSEAPNSRAYLAMGWAMITRMMLLKKQPKAELYRAILMALPALPCLPNA